MTTSTARAAAEQQQQTQLIIEQTDTSLTTQQVQLRQLNRRMGGS